MGRRLHSSVLSPGHASRLSLRIHGTQICNSDSVDTTKTCKEKNLCSLILCSVMTDVTSFDLRNMLATPCEKLRVSGMPRRFAEEHKKTESGQDADWERLKSVRCSVFIFVFVVQCLTGHRTTVQDKTKHVNQKGDNQCKKLKPLLYCIFRQNKILMSHFPSLFGLRFQLVCNKSRSVDSRGWVVG